MEEHSAFCWLWVCDLVVDSARNDNYELNDVLVRQIGTKNNCIIDFFTVSVTGFKYHTNETVPQEMTYPGCANG